MSGSKNPLPTIDFFSGAGGMSYGFHSHHDFEIVAAIDAELTKPSAKNQSSNCNQTYAKNCKIAPESIVLNNENILQIGERFLKNQSFSGVLLACPPCTDFTRAKPENHLVDGVRNELTTAIASLIFKIRPKYFVFENAREALQGNHALHLETILHVLEGSGYSYKVEVLDFNDFGLPQRRERVILLASRDRQMLSLRDLWEGYAMKSPSTVGHALNTLSNLSADLPGVLDARFPNLSEEVLLRTKAIPKNGGSWIDIANSHKALLIPSMLTKITTGRLGSYKDVYGRMALDRPAPTIKRECSHVGNGRYTHPFEDRLFTVGEMAFLQGFPLQFKFEGRQLANCYRQIGDAVPPLISYQIASLISWIETGKRPLPSNFCLKNSALTSSQIAAKVIASEAKDHLALEIAS